jgi:hypothetical protein
METQDLLLFTLEGSHLSLSGQNLTVFPSMKYKKVGDTALIDVVTSIDASVNRLRFVSCRVALAESRRSLVSVFFFLCFGKLSPATLHRWRCDIRTDILAKNAAIFEIWANLCN